MVGDWIAAELLGSRVHNLARILVPHPPMRIVTQNLAGQYARNPAGLTTAQ